MNDNRVTIIGFLFFLVCAGFIGGIYFLDGKLSTLVEEYDRLNQQLVDLEQTTASLEAQKRIFLGAFETLEGYRINVASSDMSFYTDVQQVVQASDVNILSTRQQGVSREGRSSIALTLRGDYYSLMRVFAHWRKLPLTVRVSALTLMASKTAETRGEVQADVTVEAIVDNKR